MITVLRWLMVFSMVWLLMVPAVFAQAKLSDIYTLTVEAKQVYHIQFDAVIQKIGVVPADVVVKVIDQHLWLEAGKGLSKNQVMQVITEKDHWVLNIIPANTLLSNTTPSDASKIHRLASKNAVKLHNLHYSRVISSAHQLINQQKLQDWVPYTEWVARQWTDLLQCSTVAPLQCTDLISVKLLQVWRHQLTSTQTDFFFWLFELQINPLWQAAAMNSLADKVTIDVSSMRGNWLASIYQHQYLDANKPALKIFMISAASQPMQ